MPRRSVKETVVLYYSLMTRTQKCLALTAVALVAVVSPVVAISALTFPVFSVSNNQDVKQISPDRPSPPIAGREVKMTRTQKCLALTAVALVAVVSPVVAISALTFPVFSVSNNQDVKQISLDGASLQEQDQNGVISGTCTYEDESGRTVEISYTKSQYGTVNARSPGVRDPYAAYQACVQRVEELKRQQLEAAGVYNEGATRSPSGTLSGTASQTSPSRNNPGQIQMVFQTSDGNSMQFQENASRGVTTGQCAYVDWQGRTIKISYTKHADGKVDVVTDPVVWHPKRAYRTCLSKAKEESKRLDSEMAQIESDLRQTEREVHATVARQEEKAFGWQKHFSAFPVARRKLQRFRDY